MQFASSIDFIVRYFAIPIHTNNILREFYTYMDLESLIYVNMKKYRQK